MSAYALPSMTSASDLLRPVPQAPTAGGTVDRARIDKAARAFETSFTGAMLGQMFQSLPTDPPFGGGEAEATFRSFLTDAFAKSMTAHGGIGLAAPIAREMLKLQGAS